MFRTVVQRHLQAPDSSRLAAWLARGTALYADRRARRPLPAPPPVPTVVVGGLTVGGSGKTPVVRWLVEALRKRGWRVAVVARSYRVRDVPSGPVERPHATKYGDEPSWLRRVLPSDVPILVGADRVELVRRAWRMADVVIVDDGFQDPALPRSRDLVVVDAAAPRRVLPAGPFRESFAALARADLVWIHKVDEPGARPLPAPWCAAVESRVRLTGVRSPDGTRHRPAWLRGRRVCAVAGIGRPSSFRSTVAAAGARLDAFIDRADHHVFTSRELARILPASTVVLTTEKDAERWPPDWPCWVVEVEPEIVAGAGAIAAWLEQIVG